MKRFANISGEMVSLTAVEDALAGAPVAPDGALEPGLVKFLGEQAVEAANKLESDGPTAVVLASPAPATTVGQIPTRVPPPNCPAELYAIPPSHTGQL